MRFICKTMKHQLKHNDAVHCQNVEQWAEGDKYIPKCVVKITSSTYFDKNNNLVIQKKINVLKRKSDSMHIYMRDCLEFDASDISDKIINLNECGDGVYTIDACDHQYAYESGFMTNEVDDYNYFLTKIKSED